MSIAENIKYLRKQKGMTQKKLAEESGLAVITIQQYEAGKYEPKKDSLDKLKTALRCHIYELTDKPFTTIPGDERPFISIDDLSLSLHTNDVKEFDLLSNYRNLNLTGKEEALKRVSELTEIPKYQKEIIELFAGPNTLEDTPLSCTIELATDDDKKEED